MALTKREFERKVTFGFKLLSGYHSGRIAKDDLDAFGGRQDVPWGKEVVEQRINAAWAKLISRSAFFRYWKSWDLSFADAASDAVAMNFVLLMVKNWERHGGNALAGGATEDTYIREMHILFDRLVYEYVTGGWLGSSDTHIAENLKVFDTGNYPDFSPVSEQEWRSLLDDVVGEGVIRSRSYLGSVDKRIKLLLLHYYCLTTTSGPDEEYEWDHIIPQRFFKSVSAAYSSNRHHIANLAPLPKGDNARKSDKSLCEVKALSDQFDREWLVEQIETYTGIASSDFERFCKVKDSDELIAVRGEAIRDGILSGRENLLS